jgi:molybdopterin/thiamine biosynthesis adenylyltransferase
MKTVVIVGVGALGSHVALAGRNWKAQLKVIDFDRIEQKNVQAQFHSRMGLRQNKAQALAKAMQGLFGTKVIAVPHKLTEDNVEALLGGAALVIDCTDNAKARAVIQGYVRPNEIPCLHGALSADGSFARVVWDEHFQTDHEGEEGQATCEDGEQLPTFMLASASVAVEAQRFLDRGERRSFQVMPGAMLRLA